MLSFAVPITEPINTHRLTGFNTALCTAAERKRARLTESQSAEIKLFYCTAIDVLVSFVLAGSMHTALPQLQERTAKLASPAFEAHSIKGIPPHLPLLPLLAAGGHPSHAKAFFGLPGFERSMK